MQKKSIKLAEADVLWTPGEAVRVVERRRDGTDYPELMWMPATDLERSEDPVRQLLGMFILFHAITVSDRVPVEMAHEAFLAIPEYRNAISPDTGGRLSGTTGISTRRT